MSRIDELIATLCPDGVERREIGTVLNYEQPTKYLVASKDYSDEFATPVLTAGKTFILGYTSEEDGIYPASAENPVIIFDDFTTDFKWVDFPFKAKSSGMKMLTAADENLATIRYAYYAMQMISFSPLDHKRHWISEYSHFEIPVPPIEVQREIVCTLDTFAELTDELTDELNCRRQQYAHYRDRLLSRENLEALDGQPVEMKRLDASGNFERGKRFTKNDYRDNGIPCIHYAEVYTEYQLATSRTVSFVRNDMSESLRFATKGDLVIACTGETKEDIAKSIVWEGDEPVAVHDDCHILHVSDGLNSRYLSYSFQTDRFAKSKMAYATKGKTVRIAASRLASIEIPVPSLATQQKVVDILDRFDDLTTSLTDGLPAEIEARKAQYGYYRDRLLDFPKKEAAAS